MCGIAGSFSTRPLNDSRESILNEQLQAIIHRGPDAQTTYLDKEHGLAPGHTRLSINDLEGGAQPIRSFDERFTATINGDDQRRVLRLQTAPLGADGRRPAFPHQI